MTESSNTTEQPTPNGTKQPTPKKRIEIDPRFKDVTNEGGVDIFIGAQGMRKSEPKK